jgi:hypothetical protein
MTPPLPLPVRLAAGLVATAVEQARDLPRLALELPVTAVSQALQASMRVQQRITELAIKGDRVLGVGPQIEDEPAWATFDDDLPPRNNGADRAEGATVTTLRPAPDPFADPGPVDPGSVDPEPVPAGGNTPGSDTAGSDTAGSDTAGSDTAGTDTIGTDTTGTDTVGFTTDITDAPDAPDALDASDASDAALGPEVLPGYVDLTIPQLRGRLRHLGVDDLRALLAWEHAHGDRPPYVTMLTNRIATVTET